MTTMTHRERLETVFALKKPDRTPILGGWITCPEYIAEIAGTTLDEYWDDPQGVSIDAYKLLGTDGLASLAVPAQRDDYRVVDVHRKKKAAKSLEEAVEEVDNLPSPEQYEADFDFEKEYAEFRDRLVPLQERAGDMVCMWDHYQWESGATIHWYGRLGFENFFYIIGLYPDRAQKLMEVGGAQGRCRCRIYARGVEEGLLPHAFLLGQDICTQRGPMIAVDFIEKYYIPQLRYGLEPLLEVGCRPVWHCDGDVRLLLDGLIEAGVKGFQGFQSECGVLLEDIVQRRTRDGEPLVIFGPLSVGAELPVCTPEQVREKVHHAIEVCEGNASLALFTSNTINPDIPLENIKAMYEAVQTSSKGNII